MENKNINLIAEPVRIINFYGLRLTVVEYDQAQYIPIKPISDMLGLTWRTTRDNIFSDENTALYGVKRLNPAPLNEYLGEVAEDLTPYGAEKSAAHLPVYILLEQVYMYLARVNSAKVRAMGKESAADRLLALQKEWGRVLSNYENGEIVVKSHEDSEINQAIRLANAMNKITDPVQKKAFAELTNQRLQRLGFNMSDPQGDLFNH